MKKTNLLFMTSLLGIMTLGQAMNVAAVDYDGATKATTEGSVTVGAPDPDKPEVVDPEDPDKPIEPPTPPNPNPGDLKINFVADFEFGEIEHTNLAINQNAQLIDVQVDGQTEKRVPFISIEDRRGLARQGWELRASQPSQLTNEDGKELDGAEISIQNMYYANTNNTPQIPNSRVVLNSSEQVISTANATQGAGTWSLALGKPHGDSSTDGVRLHIPANTIKSDKTYATSIVWELVADPGATPTP
ncbi:WxL domain-containing protein [Enterococcus hirae]|nr:WxL domain-containing protein [Enterococcus hirae]EMF0232649.1 WxL domain-containing protein [Enterococcus hirae]